MRFNAFVFSVDAIISLAIAGIAAAALLYIAAPAAPLIQPGQTQAQGMLQSLLDMKAWQAVGAIPQQFLTPLLSLGGAYAAFFNGSSSGSYFTLSPYPWIAYPVTVDVWVNPSSLNQSSFGGGYGGTIIESNENGGSGGWILGVRNDGKVWYWPYVGGDVFSSASVPLNRWTNIALVYEGRDSNVNIYINGRLDSSSQVIVSGWPSFMRVGARSWITGTWAGMLSNLQLYSKALTSSQVKYLYSQGIGGVPLTMQGLVGWYPLNNDIKDYSGSGSKGTVNIFTNPANGISFKALGSLYFPGAAEPLNSSMLHLISKLYLSNQTAYGDIIASSLMQNNSGLFINGTYAPSLKAASFSGGSYFTAPVGNWIGATWGGRSVNLTITAWFNSSSGGPIVGITNASTGWGVPYLSVDPNGKIYGWLWNAGQVSYQGRKNRWTFVALTYSNTTYKETLYVDGMPVNSIAGFYVGSLAYDNLTTYISQSARPPGVPPYYSGYLADVQLYNSTLSGSRILQLYGIGLQGSPSASRSLVEWWPLEGDANDYAGRYMTGTMVGGSFAAAKYIPGSYSAAYMVSAATAPLLVGANIAFLNNVSVVTWH